MTILCYLLITILHLFSMLENGNRTVTGPEDIYRTQILPEEMRFGSGQIISIVGYGSLFVVSSVANFVVLKILIARYRKTKSRVNLLLCHLAIADLLVGSNKVYIHLHCVLLIYLMCLNVLSQHNRKCSRLSFYFVQFTQQIRSRFCHFHTLIILFFT